MSGPWVLDTSALLAHCLEEAGFEIVESLLNERSHELFISAVSWLEFQVRLKELIADDADRAEILSIYDEILTTALPATREVAEAAFILRQQVTTRLPNADALIAATARLQGATLVHRDPHMAAIPESLVKQIVLPDKAGVGAQSTS